MINEYGFLDPILAFPEPSAINWNPSMALSFCLRAAYAALMDGNHQRKHLSAKRLFPYRASYTDNRKHLSAKRSNTHQIFEI